MAYKVRKLKTFRLDESAIELLDKVRQNNNLVSRFVRQAIREKFERDQPLWIEEQRKQMETQCPF